MTVRSLIALLSVVLFVSACAGMLRRAAIDQERVLAAAGFRMKLANTPERRMHLLKFSPQRQLTPHTVDGQLRFVYADADYCNCVYVGSEAANQRYQKLAIEKRISEQQLAAANANQAAAMNWSAWGGWGPWY